MFFTQTVQDLPPSPTLELSEKARYLRAQGVPVIDLGAGELDVDTPDAVKEAAIRALSEGFTKYTPVSGIADLKKAIQQKLEKTSGFCYDLSEIMVSVGAKQAIFNAFFATLSPGDEVVIPVPYWVSYPQMVRLVGGTVKMAQGEAERFFKLTPEALEAAISPQTKWLILNSPNNPTGAVYTEKELADLADVLVNHTDVWVMCDDIYQDIAYEEAPSLGRVAPFLRDRLLVVHGVSKSHAMTGWRIGYAAGPEALIRHMTNIQSQQTSGPCSIAQKAAIAAVADQSDWLVSLRKTLKERRDYMVRELRQMGFACELPRGAFYVYASCRHVIGKTFQGMTLTTDTQVADYLLRYAHVGTVPGVAFGLSPYLRLSYGNNLDILKQALDRVRTALGCGS
ncbi:pyridoxal phosphate-dependent aminotransferase [bacterium NHP-B]|nr:pyridoxal phosphate-dependent aminotransferase [bacterium NHP-B]